MPRNRSRRRRRGPRRAGFVSWSLVLLTAILLVGTGVPGVAFDTGSGHRGASIDAVDDIDGAATLNVTSALQEGTDAQCLVQITNHLGKDVTLNVSLRSDSTQLGELQRNDDNLGLQKGDSIEFDLADGAAKTVNMNVDSGTAGNTTYFHVRATASGLSVELNDRNAPIQQSAGTTCA